MAKTKVVDHTSENSENVEKTQPMENTYKVLKSLSVGDYTVNWEQNSTKTSERVVFLHNSRPQWVSEKDFSVFEYAAQWPTVRALTKFFGGEVQGSGKLVITAPTEKAQFEAATGQFAYVRWDYQSPDDAIEIVNADGNVEYIDVSQHSVPSRMVGSFRQVKFNPAGGYYADPKTGYITPEGEVDVYTGEIKLVEQTYQKLVRGVERTVTEIKPDTYWFWYIAALSNLLESRNLSISVPTQANNKLRAEIVRVWNVLSKAKAEDIKTDHGKIQYMGRVVKRERVVQTEEAEVTRTETPDYTPVAGELVVPKAGGGELDLATVKVGELIHLYDDTDFQFNSVSFLDEADRLSLFNSILRNDWRVSLTLEL
jgi:hypothetical protein